MPKYDAIQQRHLARSLDRLTVHETLSLILHGAD